MKAELKDFSSIWIDELLVDYRPLNPYNFILNADLFIGIKGEEGSDLFGVQIFTPEWLSSNADGLLPMLGKSSLIVHKYDYQTIFERLTLIIDTQSGKDWDELAMKLSRYFDWEFEDYQR